MSDYDAMRQNMRCTPVKVNPEWEDITISGNYDRIVRTAFWPPKTTRNDDGTYAYTWEFGGPPDIAPIRPHPVAVRPITVIEAEIRRAVVPVLRPEDV